MGTRGAFGVIIGEKEKIGYNQFDSYPDGAGLEVLGALRAWVAQDPSLAATRKLAADLRVVALEDEKPTAKDVKALAAYTNLSVSEQSVEDWYCLTRETQGNIGAMLECGYVVDNHDFPLDSLFCEWAYMLDFDADRLEVYKGFQETLPKLGRWAGRPTQAELEAAYEEHLVWCSENDREPWQTVEYMGRYKAVELIASFPFDALPNDQEFLVACGREVEPVEVEV